MTDPNKAGPQLAVGQVWRSAGGQTVREILDFDTKMGGENLVHYSEGSERFQNTQVRFHLWISMVRATPQSE